jgi:hypothetical protein
MKIFLFSFVDVCSSDPILILKYKKLEFLNHYFFPDKLQVAKCNYRVNNLIIFPQQTV